MQKQINDYLLNTFFLNKPLKAEISRENGLYEGSLVMARSGIPRQDRTLASSYSGLGGQVKTQELGLFWWEGLTFLL